MAAKVQTFEPRDETPDGRWFCAHCGTNARLHGRVDQRCPQAYRPATVEEARRQLELAEAAGDPARVFVARGEVQRFERTS
jgi:hypothetical protein